MYISLNKKKTPPCLEIIGSDLKDIAFASVLFIVKKKYKPTHNNILMSKGQDSKLTLPKLRRIYFSKIYHM